MSHATWTYTWLKQHKCKRPFFRVPCEDPAVDEGLDHIVTLRAPRCMKNAIKGVGETEGQNIWNQDFLDFREVLMWMAFVSWTAPCMDGVLNRRQIRSKTIQNSLGNMLLSSSPEPVEPESSLGPPRPPPPVVSHVINPKERSLNPLARADQIMHQRDSIYGKLKILTTIIDSKQRNGAIA